MWQNPSMVACNLCAIKRSNYSLRNFIGNAGKVPWDAMSELFWRVEFCPRTGKIQNAFNCANIKISKRILNYLNYSLFHRVRRNGLVFWKDSCHLLICAAHHQKDLIICIIITKESPLSFSPSDFFCELVGILGCQKVHHHQCHLYVIQKIKWF